jgi:hypothetical protein
MRRRHRTSVPFGWFLVLLMSAGAGGGVVTGLYANSMRTADALPFDDFDYFDTTPSPSVRADVEPSEDAAPAGPTLASAESTIVSSAVSASLPVENTSLFSPVLSYSSRSRGYTVAAVTPAPAPVSDELSRSGSYTVASVMAAPAPAPADSSPAVSYTLASVSSAPAPAETAATPAPAPAVKAEAKPAAFAPVRHASAGRPGGVLNDSQIANIKRRLRLTPDQESLWPAVEVALRNISYSKKGQEMKVASAHTAPMAYVDPNSADVQRLKYAALPLIMRLNENQKQEVRSMAQGMGLDGVASSF